MTFPTTFPTMTLSGHTFVRNGDLWVSRAPFTQIDWQSNAERLQADHKRFGVLTETRVGDEVKYSLHYLSSLATLRDAFGADQVGTFFEKDNVVYKDDCTVAAFEFYLLQDIGDRLRHPITDVTYFHAVGMCLAIGADLMTEEQFLRVVSGRGGKRRYATPYGHLISTNWEEYVVSSIERRRGGPVDVEDLAFPTDPETGTRHYTGNVLKWMKRNPQKKVAIWLSWRLLVRQRSGCA